MKTSEDVYADLESSKFEPNEEEKKTDFATSWLAAQSDSQRYLISLAESGPILPTTEITRMPHAKSWFSGVINVGGRIYGVVDLLDFLTSHVPLAIGGESVQSTDKKPIFISFHHRLGLNTVLSVGKILGIQHAKAMEKTEAISLSNGKYIGGHYTDSEGLGWREINMLQIAQSNAFRSIEK